MEFDELTEFVEKQHEILKDFYGFKDKKDMMYPMMLKIMEELGELSQAVLANESLQREDKLVGLKGELEGEFADTLITTMLLAHNMDIDIRKALVEKIEKIKDRFSKEK